MEAKFILTDAVRAPRVLEAVQVVDSVKEVFVIGQCDGCTSLDQILQEPFDGNSFFHLNKLKAITCLGTGKVEDELEIDQESLAWLMYSSGTTGVSKGIFHSHKTINALIRTPWYG